MSLSPRGSALPALHPDHAEREPGELTGPAIVTPPRPNGSPVALGSPPPPVRGTNRQATMTIGEVLHHLQGDFPEVTISKIRFLEGEGLVEPSRTPSGYRKFSREDVRRLHYVLAAQRDRYLPLKVIKDHLAALDRGLEPAEDGEAGGPRVPRAAEDTTGMPRPADFLPEVSELRLSRAELLASADLEDTQLTQLEEFGLIVPKSSGYYDTDALQVGKAVSGLSKFGVEPRHLRSFKTAADREIGLVEQIVSPTARQRQPDAKARAEEMVREIAALAVSLHASLVKSGLRRTLGP